MDSERKRTSFSSSPTLEKMDHPSNEVQVAPGFWGKLQGAWRRVTRGTVVSSIFILLTTCMGAGTLSLPYAFAQGGIFVFSIIFFLIMIMSIYVGKMLLNSQRYASEVYPKLEVWSYEDLAYASFGVIGRIISLLTIAVLLFLALIAYMIYTRDQLAAVMQYVHSENLISDCSPLLNCGVLMCIAFIPIFPVTLLRKLTPLQFTSFLSIFSIFLVAIIITAHTIRAHVEDAAGINGTWLPKDRTIDLAPQGFMGVLKVISYCSLSFICHFNLLPLEKELVRPTKTKVYTIIVGSILMAYTIYNLVVFSAYFEFYGDIKSDITLGYPYNDVMITIARAFLFVTILMHYPVLLHPTRSNINGAVYLVYKLIKKCCKKKESWDIQDDEEKPFLSAPAPSEGSDKNLDMDFHVPTLLWFIETLIIFSTTFIIATFINDVGLVWSFVGSTAGVLVLYVYPAAFYLRLRCVRYKKRAKKTSTDIRAQYNIYALLKEGIAWVIFGIGLVLLVVENYQAIYDVVKANEGSSNNTNISLPVCHIFCTPELNVTV